MKNKNRFTLDLDIGIEHTKNDNNIFFSTIKNDFHKNKKLLFNA